MARFDGVRFTVFDDNTIPAMHSRHITSLFEAKDGTLWIGYEDGQLTKYKDGAFTAVEVRATWSGGKILGIGNDALNDLWLLNDKGELARLKDGFTIPSPNGISGIVSFTPNPRGGLWIQRDSQISALGAGQLTIIEPEPGTNAYIQGLTTGQDGELWVMAEHRIQRWTDKKRIDDLGSAPWGWAPVHTVIQTKDRRLAAATTDHGLYIVTPGRDPVWFSRTNGFPTDWVTSLCEDAENNLWAGTGNGGLVLMHQVNIGTISPPDAWQGRAILSVTSERDGALWIGTEGAGLYNFQNELWRRYDEADGLSNHYVWSVTQDANGRIFAGTWGGGLFVKNGERFERANGLQDFISPAVALLNSTHGGLYVGTGMGLFRYENDTPCWIGRKPEIAMPDVRVITEAPDGTLWFGMSGGGLGRLKDGRLQQWHRADGLSSDFVQSLHLEENGALWIGTLGGGLNRLKEGRISVIGKPQGLPNDLICDIQDDGLGFFWIGSHGGIIRVSKAELNHAADGSTEPLHCLSYGLSDGLPTLECSGGFQPGSCRTADGRLWFPTAKGLVSIDPSKVVTNQLMPPVVIERLIVDDRVIWQTAAEKLLPRIGPGRHRYEFLFAGLSFVAPEKVRFKYRLDDLEPTWIDAGSTRSAHFTYIPPGKHFFHVIACNNDGVWNNKGAEFAFIVLPYFWETWWFRVLGAAITLGIGGGIVWLDGRRRMERLQRQQALERERSRIAQDIHDDLGASLTRISMLSESARGELENSTQVGEYLNQIYHTARELTRAMSEIVWAINPQRDSLESLAAYLEKFAQDFLRTAQIRCRLDMPLHLPAWSLSAETRHNLFLACKEALNNLVKHAGATEVRLALRVEPLAFAIEIEDNGRGFALPPEGVASIPESRMGNGLPNMACRLEEIGGHFEILNAPAGGTIVRFRIPVRLSPA